MISISSTSVPFLIQEYDWSEMIVHIILVYNTNSLHRCFGWRTTSKLKINWSYQNITTKWNQNEGDYELTCILIISSSNGKVPTSCWHLWSQKLFLIWLAFCLTDILLNYACYDDWVKIQTYDLLVILTVYCRRNIPIILKVILLLIALSFSFRKWNETFRNWVEYQHIKRGSWKSFLIYIFHSYIQKFKLAQKPWVRGKTTFFQSWLFRLLCHLKRVLTCKFEITRIYLYSLINEDFIYWTRCYLCHCI